LQPKPKVALISTGGTITSISHVGELDLYEYTTSGNRMTAEQMLEKFPHARTVADVIPVNFDTLPSTALGFQQWRKLVSRIEDLGRQFPDLAGIAILHGTATIEETAYALNLTLRTDIPVVITGAQRPASAVSTDAALNMYNAVRVAATPEARGMGVLVCLNDEINAARDVTKTSTGRLQTFRTPDFGALGHADGDRVVFYRRPLRRCAPDTPFDIRELADFPRVDIAYSHADSDGTAVRAFVAAGARGIVGAAYVPGLLSPQESAAMKQAVDQGVVVVLSSRGGSGRVFGPEKVRKLGFLRADNLTPQKARILLGMALTRTSEPARIQAIFDEY
jgi:L-asparaginase